MMDVPTVEYERKLNEMLAHTVHGVRLAESAVEVVIGRGRILAEGGWRLTDPSGVLIDRNAIISERTKFLLWKIVGARFTKWSPIEQAPGGFVLWFSSGHGLTILWDWEGLEAFTIEKIRGNPVIDDIAVKRGIR